MTMTVLVRNVIIPYHVNLCSGPVLLLILEESFGNSRDNGMKMLSWAARSIEFG